MWFVKSGILSTNRDRQEFLLGLYAIILGKSISEFRELYDSFYNDKSITFKGVREFIEEVGKTKKVCFVTINSQNYNIIEKLGIKKEDRLVVGAALKKQEETGRHAAAIMLDDGKIITAKEQDIFTSSAGCVLNALKYMAGIDDFENLIPAETLEMF